MISNETEKIIAWRRRRILISYSVFILVWTFYIAPTIWNSMLEPIPNKNEEAVFIFKLGVMFFLHIAFIVLILAIRDFGGYIPKWFRNFKLWWDGK